MTKTKGRPEADLIAERDALLGERSELRRERDNLLAENAVLREELDRLHDFVKRL